MARITTASCRQCRREGEKLFPKGAKCNTDKCAIMRREYAPGQHGLTSKRKKPSGYATQLREKQKAKRMYGVLEKQFKNYFKKAEQSKGATGEVLLQLLERRLDNVVFRSCLAESRAAARQIVDHKYVKVNGRNVNVPSYLVSEGDEIVLKAKKEQAKRFIDNSKMLGDRGIPDWIEVSPENLAIKIVRMPVKADSGMTIQENLIVELYSK